MNNENQQSDVSNQPVTIKFKKLHPDAVIPTQATSTDAGYDLVAIDDGKIDEGNNYIQYRTGIAIEPPVGYHTEIFPRSSISKTNLVLANSIGLVDEGYRGELLFRFKQITIDKPSYKKGDKIGQLVVRKTIRAAFEEVQELGSSDRGTGGFGSSGK